MVDHVGRQIFLVQTRPLIEFVRSCLHQKDFTLQEVTESLRVVEQLQQNGAAAGIDSFLSIVVPLKKNLFHHTEMQTIPDQIELEMIKLAIDWLDQTVLFYSQDIPEPKSLIAELLYAFDLVERSHEVSQLAGEVEPDTGTISDLFDDDPVIVVAESVPTPCVDPFAEDPGFGLEFDLLQRTMNFVFERKNQTADLFGEDPSLEADIELGADTELENFDPPYDLFAEDTLSLNGLDGI